LYTAVVELVLVIEKEFMPGGAPAAGVMDIMAVPFVPPGQIQLILLTFIIPGAEANNVN
jgi:hypothetical protein